MSQPIYTLLIALVLLGLAGAIWRLSSRRASLPCPAWLAWLVELDNPIFRNNSAREIIKHLGLEPGMKVLDFGCGPGRLTIPLAKRVGPSGKVTAFDIQLGMLQRGQVKAQAERLENIHFVQGAAGEGKLSRGEYDRALLVTVLGEIPDQRTALAEIFDSLKLGGLLSVTEVIADPHFQRREHVRQAAEAMGFVEQAFFGNAVSYTAHFKKPYETMGG